MQVDEISHSAQPASISPDMGSGEMLAVHKVDGVILNLHIVLRTLLFDQPCFINPTSSYTLIFSSIQLPLTRTVVQCRPCRFWQNL